MYLPSCNVFVYGTLMKGERNHSAYLCEADLLGDATLEGYDIYDLGSYPGIVPGSGTVYGELYEIHEEDVKLMDYLEDEGRLYKRVEVEVFAKSFNDMEKAYAYVYLHSVEGCEKVEGRWTRKFRVR